MVHIGSEVAYSRTVSYCKVTKSEVLAACCTDTAQIYLDVATTACPSQTGFCGQGGHANLGFVAKEGTRVGPIPDSIPMHRLRRLRRSNGNVSNGASTASAPVTLKLLSQRSRRRRPGWLSAATPEAPGPPPVPGQAVGGRWHRPPRRSVRVEVRVIADGIRP